MRLNGKSIIMKRSILSIAGYLFFTIAILSQTFKGTVTDEQGQPVEFANVALYSLPDSVLQTGTVTNAEGEFMLNARPAAGNAYIQISFIGYETRIIFAEPQQTVVLKASPMTLNEVVISGDLPKIRLRDDALVTTVQNSVLSKAGTGNDVLKRLPSLTGDDGVYSVFGKGQAKIYINNREMRDVSELDNLNSADIREVEIINNPGARYDASVKAVIRINTVPKAGDGFSFDVRSSFYQSQNTDLREQLNLNYRNNGWDVFGTFFYNYNEWYQDSKMWQKTYVDTLWTQDNTMFSEGASSTVTAISGINYEISAKQYAGIKYTLSSFPRHSSFTNMNSTVLANGELYDRWTSSEVSAYNNRPAHRLNAYYNGDFGKLKVDFNADFYGNKQSQQTEVTETSQEYENRKVNSENNVSNRLIASKLVLSYPVLGGIFSMGSEYTNTDRKDVYINTQNIVPSSHTGIKEKNNSFFAEYSRAIPIGQIGAGLRYENVRSDYFSNEIKVEEQSRHYEQWFPNVSFASQIKNVSLQLSYTAKTKRPSYRQLSSNVFYGNRFTLQTGNPFLKPSTIHDVTLVGVWKFIQIMTSYKNEKDAIIYWTEQMEDNPAISLIAYRNLEKLPSLTAFVTISPTFGIWSPQLSGGVIKQWLTITSNDLPVTLNNPMPIASFNNSFRLPKGFVFTLDANYQGSGHYQNIYLTENKFVVNAGITKSFFDERLRVELKGHDLFYGSKEGNLLYNSQMEFWQYNRNDSREIELTVRYRFNAARSKYKGTGAGDSEIGRF